MVGSLNAALTAVMLEKLSGQVVVAESPSQGFDMVELHANTVLLDHEPVGYVDQRRNDRPYLKRKKGRS